MPLEAEVSLEGHRCIRRVPRAVPSRAVVHLEGRHAGVGHADKNKLFVSCEKYSHLWITVLITPKVCGVLEEKSENFQRVHRGGRLVLESVLEKCTGPRGDLPASTTVAPQIAQDLLLLLRIS